ncbi:MAG: DUF1351 domain-containing protein [Elusimicrobiaceae bacterium]|nr:DUF1351 domain-containing protein [Elusimicrobiaceae bacterium]
MELQIQTQELAPIEANLAQIREYVSGVVAKYQGAAYTDEQIKLAKANRAELRHLKEDIEVKRKQVKAKWNEPYVAFETQIKAITALIDEPVALIDGQIKDWEERRRAARKELLEKVFNKWNTLGPLLAFETVVDAEMMKLSITDNKATALITLKLEKIGMDLAQLESIISPEFRTECIAVYTQTLDLAQAVLKEKTLKAEKAKQEAVLGAAEPFPDHVPAKKADVAEEVEDIFADTPNMLELDQRESRRFVITGTPAQINELRRAANGIGVKMHEVL